MSNFGVASDSMVGRPFAPGCARRSPPSGDRSGLSCDSGALRDWATATVAHPQQVTNKNTPSSFFTPPPLLQAHPSTQRLVKAFCPRLEGSRFDAVGQTSLRSCARSQFWFIVE